MGPSAAMRRQCFIAASASPWSHTSRPRPSCARVALVIANNCSALAGCGVPAGRGIRWTSCACAPATNASRSIASQVQSLPCVIPMSQLNPSRARWSLYSGESMPFFAALRNRTRRQPLAVVGVILLAAFVLGGLAAPWLAPRNPAAIDLLHRLESPSAAHWAGTDELGRDSLSRLLWGARLSLTVSVTVVTMSLALGVAIGGLAGYLGGWVDTALTTFAMNTFLALPGILLAIAFAAFLGPGFANLVLALAIGGWAGYARLVRAQVMAVRDREYVDAARALG